ncbi:MAG: hypothetical protein ACOZIN_08525 [Myxococcota bacterium]
MKRVTSLTLAAAGANQKMERGELLLRKGKKMPGIRCKVTVPVKNAGGGAAAMTDAERQELLDELTVNLNYGRAGDFKVYQAQTLKSIQRVARECYGSEFEGYGDSSTGLAKSIGAGATASLVFWAIIPTGRFWKLGPQHQDRRACGRSQAKTIELEFIRSSATGAFSGSFSIDGQVTVDIYPHEVSAKGDRYSVLPEFLYIEENKLTAVLPAGLPLYIGDRNAAHASAAFTNLTVKVDEEVIHDQVSAADLLIPNLDVPNTPSESQVTDRETFIYAPEPGVEMWSLPTGTPTVTQNTRDVTTMKLAYLYVPVYPTDKLQQEFEHIAANVRPKALRAASLHVIDGEEVPDRLKFAEPAMLLDRDDREWEQAGGFTVLEPGKPGQVMMPVSAVQRAKAAVAMHAAAGETKAAQHVMRTFAGAVPGAVPSPRGYGGGGAGKLLSEVATGFLGVPKEACK